MLLPVYLFKVHAMAVKCRGHGKFGSTTMHGIKAAFKSYHLAEDGNLTFKWQG